MSLTLLGSTVAGTLCCQVITKSPVASMATAGMVQLMTVGVVGVQYVGGFTMNSLLDSLRIVTVPEPVDDERTKAG